MSWLVIMMAAFVSVNLVSCGDDDDVAEEDKVGSIYGIVTELGTAEPMKAVGVELFNFSSYKEYSGKYEFKDKTTLLKTITFDDGHFEFNNLNPGQYGVTVVADGYETIDGIVSVEAGRQARIDLQIEPVFTGMDIKTTVSTFSGNKVTLKGECKVGSYYNLSYPAPNEMGFVYGTSSIPRNSGIFVKCAEDNITVPHYSYNPYIYTSTVENLDKGTYYVQAYAKNTRGTTYGDVIKFEITGAPAVSTLAATNVTETSATLNGHIDYEGDPAYTERGFVYSYSFANPTVDDSESATKKIKVSGKGADFSANVADLTINKTYHVRTYVSNSEGTWYGTSESFSTTEPDYVTVEGLYVQTTDLGKNVYWTAYNMCKNSRVGGFSDWRLPTIAELAMLYTHREEIGGFKNENYWSSDYTRYWISGHEDDYTDYYKIIDFETGMQSSFGIYGEFYARAVRTIK